MLINGLLSSDHCCAAADDQELQLLAGFSVEVCTVHKGILPVIEYTELDLPGTSAVVWWADKFLVSNGSDMLSVTQAFE